jgi:formylglycine-generating enzyme required for sulfatase activity
MREFVVAIFVSLVLSGCLARESEPTTAIIQPQEKLVETFIPVEVEGGLIEMEMEDHGDYITPHMVLIKSGTFTMGDSTDSGSVIEKPLRTINIRDEFLIGKYEITFEEYDKFVKDTKRVSPSDDGFGRERRPVINVSYEDAKAYLQWLSEKSGDRYRLPSEAEWEYVARAGSNNRFFFGDSVRDLRNYSWYWDNSEHGINPVGGKLPNMWNIHDMAGNVLEWCEDYFVDSLEMIPINGTPYSVQSSERVAKGGSWNDYGTNLRHSNRMGFPQTIKMNDTGFRAVMEIE